MYSSCGSRQIFLNISFCFWALCDFPLKKVKDKTECWVHAEGWISHWNERLLVGSQTLGHHMGYWSTCVAAEAFRRPQCKTLHPSVCGESKIYTALGHGAGLQINLGKLLWKFWLAACEEEWGSISNSSWACSEYLMGDPLIILVTHICIVLSDSFLVWDPDLFLTENIQSGLSWGLRRKCSRQEMGISWLLAHQDEAPKRF